METNKGSTIIGKKIKLIRQLVGMTQVQFGKQLGYSSSGTLSLIERGLRGIGRRELQMIEQKFNVPVGAIISDTPMSTEDLLALQNLMLLIKNKADGKTSDHFSSIIQLLSAAAQEAK